MTATETASVIASGRNAGLGMIQRGQARALGRRSEMDDPAMVRNTLIRSPECDRLS